MKKESVPLFRIFHATITITFIHLHPSGLGIFKATLQVKMKAFGGGILQNFGLDFYLQIKLDNLLWTYVYYKIWLNKNNGISC